MDPIWSHFGHFLDPLFVIFLRFFDPIWSHFAHFFDPHLDTRISEVFPAVHVFEAAAPASESGIVEINIARDDSDGPQEDTESIHSQSDQDGEPLTARVEDVEFSSGADSDVEGPRPANESAETVEPEVEVEEPMAQ